MEQPQRSTLLGFTCFLLGLTALLTACSPTPKAAKYQTFNPPESDYYQADPVAYHLHQPHASRKMAWSEHPRGTIELRTNNLGFREDADTFPGPSPEGSYRILVTGDSHTDGVVYNDESFANRLELYLNLASPSRAFEVLSGGVGYYGPFQYRGFFARQELLEPDFLIVNVFLGNDFLDTSRQLEETTGRSRPRTQEYMNQLGQADALMRGTVGQSLNQLFYFKTFPEMIAPAMEAAAGQLIGLQQDADERGIPLLITLMPSQVEIAPQDPVVRQHLELAEQVLGLEPRHLELQERLRKELASRLEAAGVHTIDLFPAFAADPENLFWRSDEHLSVRGHEKLAGILCHELDSETSEFPCQVVDTTGRSIFSDGFESGDLSRWTVPAP